MYLFKKKCLMNLMNAQDSFRTVINNVQLKKKNCFNVAVWSEGGRKNSCLLNFPLSETLWLQ